MQLKYRPEIDGLRALAVVAVLAYHLDVDSTGTPLLAGGFLGVDVFFVISGYLITSLILASTRDPGGFSYAGFYERRARRLLPALLLVMGATLPLAWLLLLPQDLVQFAQSLLASLAFCSNLFWYGSQQEYGAQSAALLPFLHTWSLAVEEQYYLVFPALLLFARRLAPARLPAIVLVASLLSLGLSEAIAARDPSAAFYLLPSRLWELGAGAWLACRRDARAAEAPGSGSAWPVVGLAMIVAAMVVPGWHAAYPGLKTALPVLGAVLVLGGSGPDPATRLLASRPMVGVGLVSYSLYLWHYPVYAFGRLWHPVPGVADKVAWVALSFALAALGWRFVERPGRDRHRVPLRRFLTLVVAASLVVVAVCVAWIAGDGYGGRLGYLDAVLRRSEIVLTEQDGRFCHSGGSGRNPPFPLRESCHFRYGRGPGARSLVLVGDSHAGALSEDLRRLAQANGLDFWQLTQAGCTHVPGYDDEACRSRANELRRFVAAIPHATVVYSARVPRFLESSLFDNGEGGREAGYRAAGDAEREAAFPGRARALRAMLEGLAADNDALVIVYPVPEQGFDIGERLLAQRWRIGDRDSLPTVSTSHDVFRARVRRSHAVLDAVVGGTVVRVHPERHFCRGDGRCVVSEGDRLYYQGDNHLSPLGAGLVVGDIARELHLRPEAPPAAGP